MKLGIYLENVRKVKPLVHNITNYVTVNDVANVLLAAGGSPIMADEAAEVEEITAICGGLNINIGTLNKRTVESMLIAGRKARKEGKPVVLDPVGAGASRLRTETAVNILKEVKPTVVRGNISEIKALAIGGRSTKGVDADEADAAKGKDEFMAIVKMTAEFAEEHDCIAAVTGQTDIISDGKRTFLTKNGRPEMSRITGTGCQLSAIIAAFIIANGDAKLEATAAAISLMGLAGEIGFNNMSKSDGNSSYRNKLIDAVYKMSGEALDEGGRCEELSRV